MGWNYDTLLPFMKRSERAEGDPFYRGTHGPMRVAPAPDHDPLWDARFDAAVEAGHPPNADSNGGTAEGTAWNDMNVVDGRRQSAADAYLRSTVTGYFHPAGTCAIGTDALSVVDPQLKVHGVTGLRVADASVMPSLVSGNTNATVLAIAERAASMLTGARTGEHADG